jgi:uncharacterized protein DUF935
MAQGGTVNGKPPPIPLDYNPFAPPKDPLKGASRINATRVVRDAPVAVVPTWSVSSVRQALQDHQFGSFAQSSLLVESVLADDRVHATLGAVSSAMFSRPVEHTPAVGEGIDPAKAEEVCLAWERVWPCIVDNGSCDTLIRWRKMMGFSLAEILWNTEEDIWVPQLKFFHPLYLLYRLDLRAYVAVTLDGQELVEPGAGKWFLHTPFGRYRGWQLGAVRAIAPLWLTRSFALRDWARYSEVHGLPMLKAKVPVGGDEGEKERFTNSLKGLGQESVFMLPQGVDEHQNYDLELLEAKDSSWEAFRALIDQCDMSIVLALMHQNLMTEMKEGSNAAARQHADVRQEEVAFIEKTFMNDLYEQVIRPWALFNFGDPDLAPRSRYQIEPTEDRAVVADILVKIATAVDLLHRTGAKVDVQALAAEFDIELVTADAAVAQLALAPTDIAKVVRVDEARAAEGLGPIGDDRGEKLISELEAAGVPGEPKGGGKIDVPEQKIP